MEDSSKARVKGCAILAAIYGLGALCLLAVLAAVAGLLSNQAIPNQCIEYRDASAVEVVAVPITPPGGERGDDVHFDPRILDGFQLLRVAPYHAPAHEEGVADTLPVLFVHGHRGAPSQAFAMATIANVRTAAEPPSPQRRAFTFYTADFHEGSSAFHSGVLLAQAWFLNDAARAILAAHPRAAHVPVFAHSMGGISARLAYHLANHPHGGMDTLVTLNTPHQAHPYGVDAAVQRLYDGLHQRWSRPIVDAGWRPISDGGSSSAHAVASASDPQAGAGQPQPLLPPSLHGPSAVDPLASVVLASVTGGAMDNLVRPDLASVAGVVAPDRGFSSSTQAIAGAWIQSGHEGIVNCGQAAAALVDALFELHPLLMRGATLDASSSGNKAEASIRARLESLRRHLADPDASAAILLSQQLPGAPAQQEEQHAEFHRASSGGLRLLLSTSVPGAVLSASAASAPLSGPATLAGKRAASAGANATSSAKLFALWRAPWDREGHAWSGRTCFDLRQPAAAPAENVFPVAGLQLMTDLPPGAFRTVLRRGPQKVRRSASDAGETAALGSQLQSACSALRISEGTAAFLALASAVSENGSITCVDVTPAFAAMPDALRRNHLHSSWDRVRKDRGSGVAAALADVPAQLAEGSLMALDGAQAVWAGITRAASAVCRPWSWGATGAGTGESAASTSEQHRSGGGGASALMLAPPLLPRSITALRHSHDHDTALALGVRARNVLRLLTLPPVVVGPFDQLCVTFDAPQPPQITAAVNQQQREQPVLVGRGASVGNAFVDSVLDMEGVEALAGRAHFFFVQEAHISPARKPGTVDAGGQKPPAAAEHLRPVSTTATEVRWVRPAGPNALVTVFPLDFLPSPYAAWNVVLEASQCGSVTASGMRPRRVNWLPGDGDPEGRLLRDSPLFFPAVRYDSGALAAALSAQKSHIAAAEAAAFKGNASALLLHLPLDCIGCESVFLRPSLATRLNAMPHLSGGAVPSVTEFALSTSALPPKILHRTQGVAGDAAAAAAHSYVPALVVIADPRCEYTVSLTVDSSTTLGQWLHHHSPWAVSALVASTLFLLSAMLKEWEGRSRIAVIAAAAAREGRKARGGDAVGHTGGTIAGAAASIVGAKVLPRLPHFPSLHHAIARSWRWMLAVTLVHAVVMPLVAHRWSPLDPSTSTSIFSSGSTKSFAETAAAAVPVMSSGIFSSWYKQHATTDAPAAVPPVHTDVMALGTPLGWEAPGAADVAGAFLLSITCLCAISLLANSAVIACRCANRCRVVSCVVLRRWQKKQRMSRESASPGRMIWRASPSPSPVSSQRGAVSGIVVGTRHVQASACSSSGSSGRGYGDEGFFGRFGWAAAEHEGTQALRLVGATVDWDRVPSTPTYAQAPPQAFLRRKLGSSAILNDLALGALSCGAPSPKDSMGSDVPPMAPPQQQRAPPSVQRSHSAGSIPVGDVALGSLSPTHRRQALGHIFHALVGEDRSSRSRPSASKRKTSALAEDDILRDLLEVNGKAGSGISNRQSFAPVDTATAVLRANNLHSAMPVVAPAQLAPHHLHVPPRLRIPVLSDDRESGRGNDEVDLEYSAQRRGERKLCAAALNDSGDLSCAATSHSSDQSSLLPRHAKPPSISGTTTAVKQIEIDSGFPGNLQGPLGQGETSVDIAMSEDGLSSQRRTATLSAGDSSDSTAGDLSARRGESPFSVTADVVATGEDDLVNAGSRGGVAGVALVWWVATGDWVAPPPAFSSTTTRQEADAPASAEASLGIELARWPLRRVGSEVASSRASERRAPVTSDIDALTGDAVHRKAIQDASLLPARPSIDLDATAAPDVALGRVSGGPSTAESPPLLHLSEASHLQVDGAGFGPRSVPKGRRRSDSEGLSSSWWSLLLCRPFCARCSLSTKGHAAETLLQRMRTAVFAKARAALAAVAAPCVACASSACSGVAHLYQLAATATPPSAWQYSFRAISCGVFLWAASFMPWLVFVGCYVALLVQTLASAATYHTARVRRRMFEDPLHSDHPALLLFAGSCCGSALAELQPLAPAADAVQAGRKDASTAYSVRARRPGLSNQLSESPALISSKRGSETRYYAHAVAVVNLLRYQQLVLLLYAAILGMQAMSIFHSLEAVPRLRHPFHRDVLWTLPMMLHVLAARSHTPATTPLLADALGLLRRIAFRAVGSGCVCDALARAQRTRVARCCSPSIAVVAVAWCVFAVSHQRLHSLPAVAGTLPAVVFLVGHARRWLQ